MINRRDFLKLSLYAGCYSIIPSFPRIAEASAIDNIRFNKTTYLNNKAQTIMIFLYGGASELAGNFTNYEDFKNLSDTKYEDYFSSTDREATENNFWKAAGGDIMEELLANHDLNVFRTCFSQKRWDEDNRSHGSCVKQNQCGSFNENASGIFSNLARILYNNGIINENTIMPFLSMDGESGFFSKGSLPMVPILEPISINENLNNPFHRDMNVEETFSTAMDTLAQNRNTKNNIAPKIQDAFAKRGFMDDFMSGLSQIPDPVLGVNGSLNYDLNNTFAKKLKTAINILKINPDTKIISLSTSGLGGWDDHNDAGNYIVRMKQIFKVLRSAVAHIKNVNQELGSTNMFDRINIMIMGDFGRSVNLNSAKGWDHGNLQTFYNLGGTGYFSSPGIVGETELAPTGSANRLYLRPTANSSWFEPNSVAATLYSIYGIENPETLTDNNGVIQELFS